MVCGILKGINVTIENSKSQNNITLKKEVLEFNYDSIEILDPHIFEKLKIN